MSSVSVAQPFSAGAFFTPPPSCTIKGRLIPYPEFLPRLKNFCLSLGFKKSVAMVQEFSPAVYAPSAHERDPLLAIADTVASDDTELVIILSTRVPYEPSWGVYSGLPRPLIHERTDRHLEGTVSHFIAPYLAQYLYARNHIYIGCKKDGRRFIALPADLIDDGMQRGGRSLHIRLDKIAEPDGDGRFSPLSAEGLLVSYPLAKEIDQVLKDHSFDWEVGRMQRIDAFLTADLLAFNATEPENTPPAKGNNSNNFAQTLLPQMHRIVTHANPQLRAAVIHLNYEFSRLIDQLLPALGPKKSVNLLCVAGLDIDVAAFKGRGERYFVPWAAYRQQQAIKDYTGRDRLQQDDLFVALMAQEKN